MLLLRVYIYNSMGGEDIKWSPQTLVCLYVVPTRLGWDRTPNQLSPNPQ